MTFITTESDLEGAGTINIRVNAQLLAQFVYQPRCDDADTISETYLTKFYVLCQSQL